MRPIALFLSMILASTPLLATADSASLLAQALQKIQAGDKNQALKILSRAYEAAQDPEDVKTIAALIIDTSGYDYPKRENFLVYLSRNARDHVDQWKWLKELGDRHFDRAQFDKAEDYYLQALPKADDKLLLNLKLAFTIWNLKRRNEAFLQFLKLYDEPAHPENTTLLSQIPQSLAKLWWETGPLPQATFSKLLQSPSNISDTVIPEVFNTFPTTIAPSVKEGSLLKQIKEAPETAHYWQTFLSQGVYFKDSPCFFFETLIGEADYAPRKMLIACAESESIPSTLSLDVHFDKAAAQEADEDLLRVYLKYLTKKSRPADAASAAMKWNGLSSASKKFISALTDLLISLSEAEWKNLYSSSDPRSFEVILNSQKNTSLLEILQSLDPERWIPFEETLYPSGQIPRSFLIKKLQLLASRPEPDLQILRAEANTVLMKPSNAHEKSAQKILRELDELQSYELPIILSEDFNKKMNGWIKGLDTQVKASTQLPPQWIRIMNPLVGEGVQKSVNLLIEQIEALQLPPEAEGIEEAFYKKKEEMKANVRNKYQDFLMPAQSSESPR